MQFSPTPLKDLLIVTPVVHPDSRGSFSETFRADLFAQATGGTWNFVQDNQSVSRRHVLRGLHYQLRKPQGKLVRVVSGAVFDVAVDLRRSSPTCGQWFGLELSAANAKQLWVPPGFAHGLLALQDDTVVQYRATGFYAPDDQHCLRYDDPAVAIAWPLGGAAPLLSDADRDGKDFGALELFA